MASALILSTTTPAVSATQAELGPGTLKAKFFYHSEEVKPEELKSYCPKEPKEKVEAVSAALFTDIAVTLAGKAVESLIDSVAARSQAEATILDVTIPIKGYYGVLAGEISVAVNRACLLFHNGSKDDASDASILMSLITIPSDDGSAFRFDVLDWKFDRFLKPKTGSWFQNSTRRDFAIKIEFLTPSSSGLGNRSVFIEQVFQNMDVASLKNAFISEQSLPWFSSPAKPTLPSGMKQGALLPLNIRITLIETTKPNQIAQWLQDLAKEKKSDISATVKNEVRKSLDPSFAATEQTKLTEVAASAYAAYKTAWDDGFTHKTSEPKKPPNAADQATQAKYAADFLAWNSLMLVKLQNSTAKRVLAKSAFQSANLSWPGDLPALK